METINNTINEQPDTPMAATPEAAVLESTTTEEVGNVEDSNGEQKTVEEPTEAQPPSDAQVIEALRLELAAEKARADDLLDKFQRTAADFQNSRRRQERQLAEEIERASAYLILRLLPVLDDLQLAFQNAPAEVDQATAAWLGGFRQIQKKLETIFEEQGVKTLSLDGAFNPNRHEAIMSEPHDTIESGHIIATLRPGYELKGRVIRPALVRIAT